MITLFDVYVNLNDTEQALKVRNEFHNKLSESSASSASSASSSSSSSYLQGIEELTTIYEINKVTLGDTHMETLDVMELLSDTYIRYDENNKAEEILKELLNFRIHFYPTDTYDMIEIKNKLTKVLSNQSKYDEISILLKECLNISDKNTCIYNNMNTNIEDEHHDNNYIKINEDIIDYYN